MGIAFTLGGIATPEKLVRLYAMKDMPTIRRGILLAIIIATGLNLMIFVIALASIVLREAMASDPGVGHRTNPLLSRIVALFEEGVRTGDIQPVRNEPYHFFSAVAGTILFYVAALPQFVADLPEDHLSRERMELLESDAVAIAERLLGTNGPRPMPRASSATA